MEIIDFLSFFLYNFHMNTSPHLPVLLDEIIQGFAPLSLDVVVDGTLGAGGHAEALLKAHPEIQCYLGIDQDQSALEIAAKRLKPWESKLVLRHGNFSQIDLFLQELGMSCATAILIDIGVSSMQLDQKERGFSFMQEGPLDMRMNRLEGITAADIVNTWSEAELGRIFREYGEEKQWRTAARAIVQERAARPVKTTQDLVRLLSPALARFSKKGIHPLTLVFQALRICVNQELEVLEAFLPKAVDLLAPGGRLAVISFHSLEDRMVKNYLRLSASDKWETSGIGGMFRDKTPIVELISKKPIEATSEEIEKNPRSRCAKLRIAQKL